MSFDDGETCEGGGDLPGMRSGPCGGVVLRDLQYRRLIQGEGVCSDIPGADRIAHGLRLADDLPHMRGREPPVVERGADEIELGMQQPGIDERKLDRPLRDVSGGRVLRGHRPLDHIPVPGSDSDFLLHQVPSLREQVCRLGLQHRDLPLLLTPRIEQRHAPFDECGDVLGHISSLEQNYEYGK